MIEDQLRQAYAGEVFSLPGSAVSRLARRRRGRQRLTVAGTAALVVATTASGVVLLGGGTSPPPPQLPPAATSTGPPAESIRLDSADHLLDVTPPWSAACLERARRDLDELTQETGWPDRFEPEAAIHLADNHQWLTVFISDQAAFACWAEFQRGHASAHSLQITGDREAWLDRTTLPAFRNNSDFSEGNRNSMVLGAAPPGTERVDVVLVDGTVVAAVLDGDWFVAWLPPATGLAFWDKVGGADQVSEVAAYTSDGMRVTHADGRVASPSGG